MPRTFPPSPHPTPPPLISKAGLEHTWETRVLHTIIGARINALGAKMQMEGKPAKGFRRPITCIPAAQLPYTVLHPKEAGQKYLMVWSIPPPQGRGAGQEAARLQHNEQLASDLADAVNLSERSGAHLAMVGLEMQGVHERTLEMQGVHEKTLDADVSLPSAAALTGNAPAGSAATASGAGAGAADPRPNAFNLHPYSQP